MGVYHSKFNLRIFSIKQLLKGSATLTIMLCVRWYMAHPLSYQYLKEMMDERDVFVNHSPIMLCGKRLSLCATIEH
jgi:hypothetical protein